MLVRQLIRVIRVAAGVRLAVATVDGVAAEGTAALLARARDAVGGDAWRRVQTQHTESVRTYLDHDDTGSSDLDFATGRYAQRLPASAVARLLSGRSFWRQRMGKLDRQAFFTSPTLETGGVQITDPTLELSTQPGGTLNSPALAGNISNGILRQLSILFDYQGGKVYIEPNKVVSAE